MIKWIISDMDGTLLDDNGNLPADFHLVMQELIKRNIKFSPASGRQLGALKRHFNLYKDDLLFIAENGIVVSEKDFFFVSTSLDSSLTIDITKTIVPLAKKGVYSVCCTPKKSYIVSKDEEFILEIEKYFSDYEIISDYSQIKDSIIKISLCDVKNKNIKENGYSEVSKFSNKAQVVISSDIWLDIIPVGVNKGTAIKYFQNKWNILPEECMAFGDYYNDKEMLLSVGESYAMDNAQKEIKAIAKHIAPSNKEYGVTKIIREKVLNK